MLAVLLSAVALLLALLLVPRFGQLDGTATVGNLLLLLITAMLFGVSLIDGVRGHRASRVLVVAWSPPFLIASAMTFELLVRNTGDVLPEVLFPVALVFSSTVMFFGLAEEIASVRSQRDTARMRADHDDLTGALARTAFDRLAASARERALAEGRAMGILFIDIDRFKPVNDQLGHARGDDALRRVVERIRECLRDADRLGRYGGEEFVVLLEDVTPESLARGSRAHPQRGRKQPQPVGRRAAADNGLDRRRDPRPGAARTGARAARARRRRIALVQAKRPEPNPPGVQPLTVEPLPENTHLSRSTRLTRRARSFKSKTFSS